MSISYTASLFSSPPLSQKHCHIQHSLYLKLHKTRNLQLFVVSGNEQALAGVSTATEESNNGGVKDEALSSNGSAPMEVEVKGVKFEDPKWVNGTWNLAMFEKNGKIDWDDVIDAEARRRKWLETNPESSSNDEPVMFDTSIIPWWAWMKRFHLPEAELLNGRAAMIGFFMAYFVDSLTGVGLVDQMGNFVCKTLLLISHVVVYLKE
ncbi:hypothetical protein Leryth_022340 [Lithospermum erythrorhizon]|nr:hypothetical protein Leryth_022340 [Lithospermum erythrorhizon]